VDRRFLEARVEIRGAPLEEEADILEEFFGDFDSSIPSWDIYVVRKFFRTFQKDVTITDLHLRRARLDARCFKGAKRREYSEWLTPSELRRDLAVKVRISLLRFQNTA
jgi:dephospho-CoA kinase